MDEEKVISINERIPSIKDKRKQRANRRVLFFLSSFFFLLLIVIYFQSPLSNIKKIEVLGNHFVEAEAIVELSELNNERSMWGIDKEKVQEKILTHLEIHSVSIERKLPNTIKIIVQENSRIGYLYEDEKFYPILETGNYLQELSHGFVPADAPILIGFQEDDALAELAAELSQMPSELIERMSEIFYEPTERDPLSVVLFMTDGFEVHTSINDFTKKMLPYPSIVKELDKDKEGILHLRMSPYFEQFHVEEEDSESED